MMISKLKKPLVFMVYTKYFRALRVKGSPSQISGKDDPLAAGDALLLESQYPASMSFTPGRLHYNYGCASWKYNYMQSW